MGRMYTLDDKLLCGSPEIRIGDKVFPIDDRQKTVKKALKIFNDEKKNKETEGASDHESFEMIDELFKLAFGKNYKEIEDMELSFTAYQELMTSLPRPLKSTMGRSRRSRNRMRRGSNRSPPKLLA